MITYVRKNMYLGEFANSYQVVMKDGTEVAVPLDPANRHYQMIQEWVAEGNTIEEGAN